MEAQRIGARMFTIENVLTPEEISYHPQSNNNNDNDIDYLNMDISKACLRLLEKNKNVNLLSNRNYYSLSKMNEKNALLIRPPCRFEIIQKKIPIICNYNQSLESNNRNEANTGVPTVLNHDIFNMVEIDVIMDVAHNVASMEQLAKRFKIHYRNRKIRSYSIYYIYI